MRQQTSGTKLIIEILISLFLHPIAVVLAWIDLATRSELSGGEKVLWGIVCIIWGLGPILYILLGHGELW